MGKYFDELNLLFNNEKLNELREYGINNNVPIIKNDGLALLLSIIRLKNVKRVLEIGTAIGYSSISMALENEDIYIDTIERNEKMYQQAVKNVKDFELEKRINVIFSDALEVDEKSLAYYDLIFIDAAKAQYIKFFEKFTPNLLPGGVVFTDNLLFHGLEEVPREEIESKNVRALVRKIDRYNNYLKDIEGFKTTFIEVGDGVALSVRKGE